MYLYIYTHQEYALPSICDADVGCERVNCSFPVFVLRLISFTVN